MGAGSALAFGRPGGFRFTGHLEPSFQPVKVGLDDWGSHLMEREALATHHPPLRHWRLSEATLASPQLQEGLPMNAVTSASGRLQAGEKNRPAGLSHPTSLGGNKQPSFTASKCWGDLWCRQFGSGPLKRREPWPSRWWRALPSVCKNHNIREAQ